MPWYRTGTVAITAGQTTVTGTGTAFSANARVGDAFQGPDGRWYEVTNIASATVLSILPAYQGVTVAGGSYALAPMQGYVKESADRLRQIVNDWGSTLAGLGSVSVEDVVPVAKGGTGGTTAALARSGLGLKAAAVADIVGAVSQSGGVPTGAILEQGENANGAYLRFASGWQICAGTLTGSPDFGVVANDYGGAGSMSYRNLNVTFPIAFARALPKLTAGVTTRGVLGPAGSTSLSGGFIQIRSINSALIIPVDWVAIGRWF